MTPRPRCCQRMDLQVGRAERDLARVARRLAANPDDPRLRALLKERQEIAARQRQYAKEHAKTHEGNQ